MTPYEAAVDFADSAIPTFPCLADKSPMIGGGFKAATIEHTPEIWAGAALVAMPTGAASGVDVLDVDVQHGGAEWFRKHAHKLPRTRYVRTRSGGLHIYFRARPGLRCSVSKIAPGVDVRAEGGFVILWAAPIPGAGLESGTLDPRTARDLLQ